MYEKGIFDIVERVRPFLVALRALFLALFTRRVYSSAQFFASRFLLENGGDLRDVLAYIFAYSGRYKDDFLSFLWDRVSF